jgi:hypothetical protein
MGVIATGQYTIMDYNDAITLTGFITSNQAKTQVYDTDTGLAVPSWATSPYLLLTPSLYRAGDSSDIITSTNVKSIRWYNAADMNTEIVNGALGGTYVIPATGLKTLTVQRNILIPGPDNLNPPSAIDYVCVVDYEDPTTLLRISTRLSISFNRVINGGGIADAVAWCPNGNIFKNGTIASLIAHGQLMRGSVSDATATYQWYISQAGATDDSSIGVVGAGWKRLSSSYNLGCSGYASQDLTVPNSAILNIGIFKFVARDTETGSYYADTVTIVDQSDPFQIIVESSGGDVFKNGVGTSTLTARVFRAGSELDPYVVGQAESAYTYIYTWTLKDKDGNADNFWNSATQTKDIPQKTGKQIQIDGNDINVKGTMHVEVSTR